MDIAAALGALASLLQVLNETSQSGRSASGDKIVAIFNALQQLSVQAQRVSQVIRTAAAQGRSELTDEERKLIKDADDAARAAQMAALQSVIPADLPENPTPEE